METRTINTLNQLTQVGGAGETVIEGTVNEFATVQVTLANEAGATLLESEPAELRADPATGGYSFRRAVPVSEGTNTVTLHATDTETPPQTTTQSWQFDVPPATRTFTYDANGNTLSDGLRTMTWDAKNRLKSVTKAGTTWKWDYDHADRRVREYTDDVLTKVFVWSGTELVQERDANNAITRTHYHGGFSDGPTPATGTKYQTLTDHLGNIREVLTASGTRAARYDYTPYQSPEKIGTSTVEPTFLTIGRYQHHPATGLELALYRAYDPGLGRWMSRDPIEEEGGVNLYAYVANDPIKRVDPLGLQDFLHESMVYDEDVAAAQAAHLEALKTAFNWSPWGRGRTLCQMAIKGGGQNARKASKWALDKAKQAIEAIRQKLQEQKSKPNKTPEDKKEIEKTERELKRAIDQARKSEEHSRCEKR
jgi:RHS repeat-associated protein